MDDLKAKHGDRLWLAELDLSETASIRESSIVPRPRLAG
jgi:hypothetical protein